MRVCFVVQRYGADVAGGAEALCRRTAHALAASGDQVRVHTTTARDYLTWAPHYAPGVEMDGGVEVVRHAVDPPNPGFAAAAVRRLGIDPTNIGLENAWAKAQGPVSPGLLRALSAESGDHEAVAFWTYLYATSQMGLPLVRDRSVLVPLAHPESMLRFPLTRALVRAAQKIAYMTPEEAQLVQDLHGPTQGAVVGSGVDPAPLGDAGRARRRQQLPRRFALYLGRVDASKGLPQLIRAHKRYLRGGGKLGLVLAGRRAGRMRLPRWAVTTGFLTEQERTDLLAAADAVVLPSPYESLSLVALEAWAAGAPTLANMKSAVLTGQTARSGGGLLYDSERYARQLTRLASDDDLRKMLADRGRAFTAAQSWDEVARSWRRLLASVRQPVGPDSSTNSVASMSIKRPSRQVPSGARS